MSVDAKVLAAAFRQLSHRFDHDTDGLARFNLMEQAGGLLVDAVGRGLLTEYPDIVALADWCNGDGEHPERVPSSLVQCAANVWISVVGNNRIAFVNRRRADGTVPVIGDTHGGILPSLYRAAFPGRSLDDIRVRDDALACNVLAIILESLPADIPSADEGYLEHRNAVAMLKLVDKTSKELSKIMEAIRKIAGGDLRCRKAGNRWEYHAGDWQRIVDMIRSRNGHNAPDDESGLRAYTDPTPEEIEDRKQSIRRRE